MRRESLGQSWRYSWASWTGWCKAWQKRAGRESFQEFLLPMKHLVRSAGRPAGPGSDTNRRIGATGCRNGAPSREDATARRALGREGARQGRSPSRGHGAEGMTSGCPAGGLGRIWRSSRQGGGPSSLTGASSSGPDRTPGRLVKSHARRKDVPFAHPLWRARLRTMNASTNVSPSTRKRDASNFDDYLLLAMGLALVVTLALL